MTTAKKSFESVKKRADEMTGQRIAQFLMSLEGNLPSVNGVIQWKSLPGKELPATTIDNWLRRAADAGRLAGVSLNRAAFEVWKRLEEAGRDNHRSGKTHDCACTGNRKQDCTGYRKESCSTEIAARCGAWLMTPERRTMDKAPGRTPVSISTVNSDRSGTSKVYARSIAADLRMWNLLLHL